MSKIRQIRLIDVKTHEDTTYDFEDPFGIYRLSGGNSACKTGTYYAFALLFKRKVSAEYREMLIADYKNQAKIYFKFHNGAELVFIIDRIAKNSFVALSYEGSVLRRQLNDHAEILDKLNFHYNEDLDFSLHLYLARTDLPFTHKLGSFNFKILEDISTDKSVELFRENIAEGLSIFEMELSNVKSRILFIENNLDDSRVVDQAAKLRKKITLLEIIQQRIELKSKLSFLSAHLDSISLGHTIDITKLQQRHTDRLKLHSLGAHLLKTSSLASETTYSPFRQVNSSLVPYQTIRKIINKLTGLYCNSKLVTLPISVQNITAHVGLLRLADSIDSILTTSTSINSGIPLDNLEQSMLVKEMNAKVNSIVATALIPSYSHSVKSLQLLHSMETSIKLLQDTLHESDVGEFVILQEHPEAVKLLSFCPICKSDCTGESHDTRETCN